MTAKLLGSAPILLVRDVVAAADYYRDRLGFRYDRFWGDPPSFCILARDGLHLMLSRVEDPAEVVPRKEVVDSLWDVYFWVDDAEALYAELVERGAKIGYAPRDEPYGCREFGIEDLDGHSIAFGQGIEASGDE